MSGIALDLRVKEFFFDQAKVGRAVKAGKRKALSRIGAFVRKRAKSRLRRRKRVSNAGESPSIHSRNPEASLKKILFAYEPNRESVVIGPVKLNQVNQSWIDAGSVTVPQLLEVGGVVAIREKSTDGGVTWRRRDLRRGRRPNEKHRTRRAVYQPRPFMGPALQAEIDAGTIPQQFRGVVVA